MLARSGGVLGQGTGSAGALGIVGPAVVRDRRTCRVIERAALFEVTLKGDRNLKAQAGELPVLCHAPTKLRESFLDAEFAKIS